jgi:hypothetical protein
VGVKAWPDGREEPYEAVLAHRGRRGQLGLPVVRAPRGRDMPRQTPTESRWEGLRVPAGQAAASLENAPVSPLGVCRAIGLS